MNKKVVLGMILAAIIIYAAVNILAVTNPETSATIKTGIPMLNSKVGFSLDGALKITAPETAGHWKTENGYLTDQTEVYFCPIETIGVQKYTFIPDNPEVAESSVYSVVFVRKAYIQEMLLVILLGLIFLACKLMPAPKRSGKKATAS